MVLLLVVPTLLSGAQGVPVPPSASQAVAGTSPAESALATSPVGQGALPFEVGAPGLAGPDLLELLTGQQLRLGDLAELETRLRGLPNRKAPTIDEILDATVRTLGVPAAPVEPVPTPCTSLPLRIALYAYADTVGLPLPPETEAELARADQLPLELQCSVAQVLAAMAEAARLHARAVACIPPHEQAFLRDHWSELSFASADAPTPIQQRLLAAAGCVDLQSLLQAAQTVAGAAQAAIPVLTRYDAAGLPLPDAEALAAGRSATGLLAELLRVAGLSIPPPFARELHPSDPLRAAAADLASALNVPAPSMPPQAREIHREVAASVAFVVHAHADVVRCATRLCPPSELWKAAFSLASAASQVSSTLRFRNIVEEFQFRQAEQMRTASPIAFEPVFGQEPLVDAVSQWLCATRACPSPAEIESMRAYTSAMPRDVELPSARLVLALVEAEQLRAKATSSISPMDLVRLSAETRGTYVALLAGAPTEKVPPSTSSSSSSSSSSTPPSGTPVPLRTEDDVDAAREIAQILDKVDWGLLHSVARMVLDEVRRAGDALAGKSLSPQQAGSQGSQPCGPFSQRVDLRQNPDGSWTFWADTRMDCRRDNEVTTPRVPKTAQTADGRWIVYDDRNGNGHPDEGEVLLDTRLVANPNYLFQPTANDVVFMDPTGSIVVTGTGRSIMAAPFFNGNPRQALVLSLGGDDLWLNNAGGSAAAPTVTSGEVVTTLDPQDAFMNASASLARFNAFFSGVVGALVPGTRVSSQDGTRLSPSAGNPLAANPFGAFAVAAAVMADPQRVNRGLLELHPANVTPQVHFTVAVALDVGGNDRYLSSEPFTQGAAGFFNVGVLLDREGNDHYVANNLSQGVGVTGGIGILVDVNGKDRYAAGEASQGFGLVGGMGLLTDLSQQDRYEIRSFGQGTAMGLGSIGVLADLGRDEGSGQADDVFRARGHEVLGWVGAVPAVGEQNVSRAANACAGGVAYRLVPPDARCMPAQDPCIQPPTTVRKEGCVSYFFIPFGFFIPFLLGADSRSFACGFLGAPQACGAFNATPPISLSIDGNALFLDAGGRNAYDVPRHRAAEKNNSLVWYTNITGVGVSIGFDDANGDGVPNLLYSALGMDPFVANPLTHSSDNDLFPDWLKGRLTALSTIVHVVDDTKDPFLEGAFEELRRQLQTPVLPSMPGGFPQEVREFYDGPVRQRWSFTFGAARAVLGILTVVASPGKDLSRLGLFEPGRESPGRVPIEGPGFVLVVDSIRGEGRNTTWYRSVNVSGGQFTDEWTPENAWNRVNGSLPVMVNVIVDMAGDDTYEHLGASQSVLFNGVPTGMIGWLSLVVDAQGNDVHNASALVFDLGGDDFYGNRSSFKPLIVDVGRGNDTYDIVEWRQPLRVPLVVTSGTYDANLAPTVIDDGGRDRYSSMNRTRAGCGVLPPVTVLSAVSVRPCGETQVRGEQYVAGERVVFPGVASPLPNDGNGNFTVPTHLDLHSGSDWCGQDHSARPRDPAADEFCLWLDAGAHAAGFSPAWLDQDWDNDCYANADEWTHRTDVNDPAAHPWAAGKDLDGDCVGDLVDADADGDGLFWWEEQRVDTIRNQTHLAPGSRQFSRLAANGTWVDEGRWVNVFGTLHWLNTTFTESSDRAWDNSSNAYSDLHLILAGLRDPQGIRFRNATLVLDPGKTKHIPDYNDDGFPDPPWLLYGRGPEDLPPNVPWPPARWPPQGWLGPARPANYTGDLWPPLDACPLDLNEPKKSLATWWLNANANGNDVCDVHDPRINGELPNEYLRDLQDLMRQGCAGCRGVPAEEIAYWTAEGYDPVYDPGVGLRDPDQDGYTILSEFRFASDPLSDRSYPPVAFAIPNAIALDVTALAPGARHARTTVSSEVPSTLLNNLVDLAYDTIPGGVGVGRPRAPVLSHEVALLHAQACAQALQEEDERWYEQCLRPELEGIAHATTYWHNYSLVLDTRGDDRYRNNAGGSFTVREIAGVALPNWTYVPIALLVDLEGNNLFDAAAPSAQAAATFLDVDRRRCLRNSTCPIDPQETGLNAIVVNDMGLRPADLTQTPQIGGVGMLLSLGGGNDVYRAPSRAQAYAGVGGLALLYDAGGNDRYNPLRQACFDASTIDCFQPGGDGSRVRGVDVQARAEGGIAILASPGGDDSFLSCSRSQASASFGGLAVLFNGAGNDRYLAEGCLGGAPSMSQAHASMFGMAMLADWQGRDTYRGRDASQGSGEGGVAILFDAAGHDRYEALNRSQGYGTAVNQTRFNATLAFVKTLTDGGNPVLSRLPLLQPLHQCTNLIPTPNNLDVPCRDRGLNTTANVSRYLRDEVAVGVGVLLDLDGDDRFSNRDHSGGYSEHGVKALPCTPQACPPPPSGAASAREPLWAELFGGVLPALDLGLPSLDLRPLEPLRSLVPPGSASQGAEDDPVHAVESLPDDLAREANEEASNPGGLYVGGGYFVSLGGENDYGDASASFAHARPRPHDRTDETLWTWRAGHGGRGVYSSLAGAAFQFTAEQLAQLSGISIDILAIVVDGEDRLATEPPPVPVAGEVSVLAAVADETGVLSGVGPAARVVLTLDGRPVAQTLLRDCAVTAFHESDRVPRAFDCELSFRPPEEWQDPLEVSSVLAALVQDAFGRVLGYDATDDEEVRVDYAPSVVAVFPLEGAIVVGLGAESRVLLPGGTTAPLSLAWTTAPLDKNGDRIEDGIEFEIELSTSDAFAPDETTTFSQTEFDLDPGSLAEGRWWWRVRGVDALGQTGEWSAPSSFWYDDTSPAVQGFSPCWRCVVPNGHPVRGTVGDAGSGVDRVIVTFEETPERRFVGAPVVRIPDQDGAFEVVDYDLSSGFEGRWFVNVTVVDRAFDLLQAAVAADPGLEPYLGRHRVTYEFQVDYDLRPPVLPTVETDLGTVVVPQGPPRRGVHPGGSVLFESQLRDDVSGVAAAWGFLRDAAGELLATVPLALSQGDPSNGTWTGRWAAPGDLALGTNYRAWIEAVDAMGNRLVEDRDLNPASGFLVANVPPRAGIALLTYERGAAATRGEHVTILLLAEAVTPSLIHQVSVEARPFTGEDGRLQFRDDGLAGDLVADDRIWTLRVAVDPPESGTFNLPVLVEDVAGFEVPRVVSVSFDVHAPVVTDLAIDPLRITAGSAVVTARTDERATGVVHYARKAGFNGTFQTVTRPGSGACGCIHEITVPGLDPSTTYLLHFQAIDAKDNGADVLPEFLEFTTRETSRAPEIQLLSPAAGDAVGGVAVVRFLARGVPQIGGLVEIALCSPMCAPLAELALSLSADFEEHAWTWSTVGLPDGDAYLLRLTLRDAQDLWATDASGRFVVDNAPPQSQLPSLAGVTRECPEIGHSECWFISEVGVSLAADDNLAGVTRLQYRLGGGNWTNYTRPFLLREQGRHEIGFRAADRAGNVEAERTLDVRIDRVEPSGSLRIERGASVTKNAVVRLDLLATDATSGVASMRFSNDGLTWSPWEPFAPVRHWLLDATRDGRATVWAEFRDAAGLESSYRGVLTRASIEVDPRAPLASRVAVGDGSGFVRSREVRVHVGADDGSIAFVRLANEDGIWSAWTPASSFVPWTLSPGEGRKVVLVQTRNAAGSVGETARAEVVLDMTPPSQVRLLRPVYDGSGVLGLAWEPARDAGGVAGYRVERSVDGVRWVLAAETSESRAKDHGAVEGRSYQWRVVAIDQAGNRAPASLALREIPRDLRFGDAGVLSAGTVDPPVGGPSTLFRYTVVWTDVGGERPSEIHVLIDGEPVPMQPADPFVVGCEDGCLYVAQAKLAPTTLDVRHTFAFAARDAQGEARFPDGGERIGPAVTAADAESQQGLAGAVAGLPAFEAALALLAMAGVATLVARRRWTR
ncbi:MAG TPA: fibronectin type III domain-containing protein [Candidatus Thermoplasmatota archaeon]|nr:fibronectin type III domain-containing protein [Candidatus Thermoplasmatota archaeon]